MGSSKSVSPFDRREHALLTPPIQGHRRMMSPFEQDFPLSPGGKQYQPLPYASNYHSLLHPSVDDNTDKRLATTHEQLLKKYYESKLLSNNNRYRHTSVGSASDASIGDIERSRAYNIVDKFSRYADITTDIFDAHLNPQYSGQTSEIPASFDEASRDEVTGSLCTNGYLKYHQKLMTINFQDISLLKSHSFWMPTVRQEFRDLIANHGEKVDDLYRYKTSPLFMAGTNYIPKIFDPYGGSSIIPSLFSEHKLPTLIYHSSIECNGKVYMFGGLMPCNNFDDDAPDLKDFVVHGIENLPPPLLDEVVNNPAMVNNPHLYVLSVGSCHLSRPMLTGNVPPSLLCMQCSKLTDRYLFFYGGFEIITSTKVDNAGKYHLGHSALMNSTGYILDIITFKFTKIDIVSSPDTRAVQSSNTYPSMVGRFGHLQISFNNAAAYRESIPSCSSAHSKPFFDNCETNASISGASSPVESTTRPTNASARVGTVPLAGIKVNSILVFGGYWQTGDDKYEALDDMWRIEISVAARSKRGYFKFNEVAVATRITPTNENEKWPEARAFAAACIPSASLTQGFFMESDILKDLEDNFSIETETESVTLHGSYKKEEPVQRRFSSHSGSFPTRPVPLRSTSYEQASLQSQAFLSRSRSNVHVDDSTTLVLHGGSNWTHVFGDMWWFDLQTEKWTDVTTYAKDAKTNQLVEISIPLVGHTLTTAGHVATLVGGLIRQDVDEMYGSPLPQEFGTATEIPIGSTFLSILDLKSQCLEGYKVNINSETTSIQRSTTSQADLVLTLASSVVQSDGILVIIGGLLSRRSPNRKFHLRGTVLKCVLPSVSFRN